MSERIFTLWEYTHVQGLYRFIEANWGQPAAQEKPLVVEVHEYKERRTVSQNKRYWAILGEIAEAARVVGKQFSAEAWHEHFKRKYIGQEDTPDGGTVGISTTTLNVQDFGDYMTKIEQYAVSELGVEFQR